MVTLEIFPDFTSSRNCEYSIGACAAWRVLNWLNTVISTSPMTSQMTRFLSILFKTMLLGCHCGDCGDYCTAARVRHLTARVNPTLPRKSRPIHPAKPGALRLLLSGTAP